MKPKQACQRTRVKICGISRPEDAEAAALAGADAIGLVFYEPSPRAITIEQAQAICTALPPFVTRVGLFVEPEPALVRKVLDSVPIDVLQFHGDEAATDCESFGKPYLKAARVQPGFDLDLFISRYPGACGILIDSYQAGKQGGTGKVFDWSLIPDRHNKPLILAGGLKADNVMAAIRRVQPLGVDVSGGVESAPGIKDAGLISQFIREVNNVEREPDRNSSG